MSVLLWVVILGVAAGSVACLFVFVRGAAFSRLERHLLMFCYLLFGVLILLRVFREPWSKEDYGLLACMLLPAVAFLLTISLIKSLQNIRRLIEPYSADIDRIAGQSLVHARRLVVLVTGCTLMAVGAVMLLTPGPGVVTIVFGLAILATEFIWAKRLLNRVKKQVKDAANSVLGKQDNPPQ